MAGLPWPAQREVAGSLSPAFLAKDDPPLLSLSLLAKVKRKKKLREVTADLFVAARRQVQLCWQLMAPDAARSEGTGDVEALLKQDEAFLDGSL